MLEWTHLPWLRIWVWQIKWWASLTTTHQPRTECWWWVKLTWMLCKIAYLSVCQPYLVQNHIYPYHLMNLYIHIMYYYSHHVLNRPPSLFQGNKTTNSKSLFETRAFFHSNCSCSFMQRVRTWSNKSFHTVLLIHAICYHCSFLPRTSLRKNAWYVLCGKYE